MAKGLHGISGMDVLSTTAVVKDTRSPSTERR
jgi:hypothetical protein